MVVAIAPAATTKATAKKGSAIPNALMTSWNQKTSAPHIATVKSRNFSPSQELLKDVSPKRKLSANDCARSCHRLGNRESSPRKISIGRFGLLRAIIRAIVVLENSVPPPIV